MAPSRAEFDALARWLRLHEHLLDSFPCLHLAVLMQNVLLAGGPGSEHERALLRFCAGLSERVVRAPETVAEGFEQEAWARTSAPVCQPASVVCECAPAIVFPGRSFCFTGRARTATRSKLQALVTSLGGTARGGVSRALDFLVIGAQSSPAWMFASYGRKIEAAMNLRLEGHGIRIVGEEDFVSAADAAVR